MMRIDDNKNRKTVHKTLYNYGYVIHATEYYFVYIIRTRKEYFKYSTSAYLHKS